MRMRPSSTARIAGSASGLISTTMSPNCPCPPDDRLAPVAFPERHPVIFNLAEEGSIFQGLFNLGSRFRHGKGGHRGDDIRVDAGCLHQRRIEQRLMVEYRQPGEVMPLTGFIIVKIMGRRDLDGTRAEFEIDQDGIAHDGNGPLSERQSDRLAYEMAIAGVVGVHGHRSVAQHGFRSCGGDSQ